MPFPKGYVIFSGPAGGRSLALAAPLWQDMICIDGNCSRQVILFVGGACCGCQVGRWALWGFSVVSINCSRSARWILISARQFLLLCVLVLSAAARCPRTLFWYDILGVKVGCWAHNSLGSQILKCHNFGSTCRFPRATPIFPALPGAAR